MKNKKIILLTLCIMAFTTNGLCQSVDEKYIVSHLGHTVNSKQSESGASVMDDTLLIFSCMKEVEEAGTFLEQEPMLMQIYQSVLDSDGVPGPSTLFSFQINSLSSHTYNAAFDSRNNTLYFTYCKADDDSVGRCTIYSAIREGTKWKHIHRVGGAVNSEGNNTHPAVGYLSDGSTILYFTSDRPGGLGGRDIWYAIIRYGKVATCANLGTPVNSDADEVTPFYDNEDGVLYFSSNRADGMGEYDIYSSKGNRDTWTPPINLGDEINSAYNDLFFTVAPNSSPTPVAPGLIRHGYFSSNRKDSFYAIENSCCTDIYRWQLVNTAIAAKNKVGEKADTLTHKQENIHADTIEIDVSFQQAARSLLPIKLFFHNDEPDPRSMATTTMTTYYQTYNRYMFMRGEYIQAWDNETDTTLRRYQQEGLTQFFDAEVQGNCDRLESFLFFLSEDLAAGRKVSLTVSGYASQLHTSEYNERLSKRRICSIVNQMREWHGGALRRYLDNGTLRLSEVPYGSSQSSEKSISDHGKTSSVYSIEACHERRIDILDYTYF